MSNESKNLTNASGGQWQGAFMQIQNPTVRRIALALLILIPVILIGWLLIGNDKPSTDTSEYHGVEFNFNYPIEGTLKEYDRGVVSIGNEIEGEYSPLVEVVRYKSDPDVALPATFEEFAKKQAQFLCGSDAAEKVTCSNPQLEPYSSPTGYTGFKLSQTITRTNLASGTTTAATYAPIYVLNTTKPVEPGEKPRYEGIFIYHALPAILSGAVSTALMEQILNTLTVPDLNPK